MTKPRKHGADYDAGMLTALVAQSKAESLRTQAEFFRAVDMPVAADMCEQSAIGWDHSRAIALDARPIPPGELRK